MRLLVLVAGLALGAAAAQTPESTDRLIADCIAELSKGSARNIDVIGARNEGDFAAESLVQIGAPSIPRLIGALRSGDGWVRVHAAECLISLKAKSAFAPIEQALDAEQEPGVKAILVGAYGRLGGARTLDRLIKFAGSKEPDVARAAVEALGELGDPRSIPCIVPHLADKRQTMQTGMPVLDYTAADALARIGASAVDELLKAAKNQSEDMRRAATDALCQIKDPRVTTFLIQKLGDASWRKYLDNVLQVSVQPKTAPAILRLLQGNDWEGISVAVRALRPKAPSTSGALLAQALLKVIHVHAKADDRTWSQFRQLLLAEDICDSISSLGDRRQIGSIRAALRELYQRSDYDKRIEMSVLYTLERLKAPFDANLYLQIALAPAEKDPYGPDSASAIAARACARQGLPLVKALREKYRSGKLAGAVYGEALTEVTDPRCTPILREAAADKVVEVRKCAIWGLGNVRDVRADKVLIGTLASSEAAEAAASLLRKGHPSGLDYYIAHGLRVASYDLRDQLRAFALYPGSLLTTACKANSPGVRLYAGITLSNRKIALGRQTLIALASGSPDVAEPAIEYLAGIPEARPALTKAMQGPNLRVRVAAYQALRTVPAASSTRVH